MHYKDRGRGKPVVLLHGYCETSSVWDNMVPELEKKYRVITPDLPGFGSSPILPQLSIDAVAKSVNNLIGSIGIGDYCVIGHSLGGYITLSIVDQFPSNIRGFGLFHSSAFEDSVTKKKSREQLIKIVQEKGPEIFLNSFYKALFHQYLPDTITSLEKEGRKVTGDTISAYAKAMKNRKDRRYLLKNELPKLIIAGKEDNAVSTEDSLEMAELAQNCDFLALENCGHMGMFEQPEISINAIQLFLNRVFSTS